jgi:hypothetical protein
MRLPGQVAREHLGWNGSTDAKTDGSMGGMVVAREVTLDEWETLCRPL